MDQPAFDTAAVFDEDYLYFYAELLSEARSDTEADLLWRLLDLESGMQVLDPACGHYGSAIGWPSGAAA